MKSPFLSLRALLDRLSYRRLQWLVFLCLLVHNLEEALTVSAYHQKSSDFLRKHLSARLAARLPDPAEFSAALLWATLLPLLLTILATRGKPSPLKNYTIALLGAALLSNVFLPHLPAAIVLGGYAPGIVTAVFLNLPLGAYFLRRSLREERITRNGLAIVLFAATAFLALGLPLLWWAILS